MAGLGRNGGRSIDGCRWPGAAWLLTALGRHWLLVQLYVPHREGCWWDWRSRKLQDHELIRAVGTPKDGKLLNFRTDFSARESYEQQDAATGQKPNVGSVCVSTVQHSPTRRSVTTFTKDVLSEDDAKGFARKVVTYSKGENKTEEKLVLRTVATRATRATRASTIHTFHQDIISMYKASKRLASFLLYILPRSSYPHTPASSNPSADCRYKTGKVMHAFVAWHEGKVLPGCQNYEHEEGEKWTEEDFPALLPELEEARGFTDGAPPQYQQRQTTCGTARCFADLGVRISHHIHERYDFKGPWDAYGKESTESRRSAVRNRVAVINNAYLHAKHNAQAMARPKQVRASATQGREGG